MKNLSNQIMQKGNSLIFLLVGIVILVVAGGAFYLGRSTSPKPLPTPIIISQNPEPTPTSTSTDASPAPIGSGETANWKTYTNSQYSFSFKYPPSYSYKANHVATSPNYPEIKFALRIDSQESTIELTLARNYKKFTLENALGYGPNLAYIDNFLKGKAINKLKVDGLDAIMVNSISAGQAGTATDLIILKGEDIYQITLSPYSVSKNAADDFMRIISSFKFI